MPADRERTVAAILHEWRELAVKDLREREGLTWREADKRTPDPIVTIRGLMANLRAPEESREPDAWATPRFGGALKNYAEATVYRVPQAGVTNRPVYIGGTPPAPSEEPTEADLDAFVDWLEDREPLDDHPLAILEWCWNRWSKRTAPSAPPSTLQADQGETEALRETLERRAENLRSDAKWVTGLPLAERIDSARRELIAAQFRGAATDCERAARALTARTDTGTLREALDLLDEARPPEAAGASLSWLSRRDHLQQRVGDPDAT